LLIIEDQFKQTNERLEEIQNKIKACIPDKEIEHREKVKRTSLHHQLQIEMVLLNKTFGVNKKHQTDIGAMR